MGCYVGGDFLCQFGSGIVKWKHVPRDCGLYVGLVVFGLSVVLTVYIFPMDHREMMDEARAVMMKNGQDGLASSIGVEPYSGGFGKGPSPGNVSHGSKQDHGTGRHSASNQVGNNRTKNFTQMTLKEKVDVCCRGFNSAAGCSRNNCHYKHQCSATKSNGKVCWMRGHGVTTHV